MDNFPCIRIQEPETVTYNRSNYRASGWTSEKEVGPQIVHRYIVENRGPSDINEAEAFIVWPTYASSGEAQHALLDVHISDDQNNSKTFS